MPILYTSTNEISFNSAWMQFHLRKRRKKTDTQKKMKMAAIHYKHRILRVHLQDWKVISLHIKYVDLLC